MPRRGTKNFAKWAWHDGRVEIDGKVHLQLLDNPDQVIRKKFDANVVPSQKPC